MKEPRGSATKAFMLLWFYAQWGSTPKITDMYDPRVRQQLGLDLIAGSYAQARGYILATWPRIAGVLRTRHGTLVNVELLSATETPRAESFLFGRFEDTWHVRYDTFLGSQLQYYVQTLVQERIAPGAKTPSPRAVLAGVRASRRYRALSQQP
jgi:hypothetical protein